MFVLRSSTKTRVALLRPRRCSQGSTQPVLFTWYVSHALLPLEALQKRHDRVLLRFRLVDLSGEAFYNRLCEWAQTINPWLTLLRDLLVLRLRPIFFLCSTHCWSFSGSTSSSLSSVSIEMIVDAYTEAPRLEVEDLAEVGRLLSRRDLDTACPNDFDILTNHGI